MWGGDSCEAVIFNKDTASNCKHVLASSTRATHAHQRIRSHTSSKPRRNAASNPTAKTNKPVGCLPHCAARSPLLQHQMRHQETAAPARHPGPSSLQLSASLAARLLRLTRAAVRPVAAADKLSDRRIGFFVVCLGAQTRHIQQRHWWTHSVCCSQFKAEAAHNSCPQHSCAGTINNPAGSQSLLTCNISAAKSRPDTLPAGPTASASSMARSPLPQHTSSARCPGFTRVHLTAMRFHSRCWPRLRRSFNCDEQLLWVCVVKAGQVC